MDTPTEKRSKSQARKDYWASITPEERSKRASATAKAKWAQMTPQERSNHGKMMISARNNPTE